MRQPHAEMIAIGRQEYLRLVAQTAKADRMDDPVAVALEGVPWAAHPLLFLMEAAAAGIGV
jgi:hypothetical protein